MIYTEGNNTVELRGHYLNDGIRLILSTYNSAQEARLVLAFANGGTFEEKRVVFNGKCEWQLQEYLKQENRYNWRRIAFGTPLLPSMAPIAVANDARPVTSRLGIDSITIIVEYVNSTEEINLPLDGLDIVAGYKVNELEDQPRLPFHLFNPNFEHIAEAYSDKDVLQLVLKLDQECPAYYSYKGVGGNYKTAYQFRLNDYWDDRETDEAHTLKLGLDGTQYHYRVDKRTKGAYLRFLDEEGLLQHLLLDIESTERTYGDGELVRTYKGRSVEYEDHGGLLVNEGYTDARRTETTVLHCSVSNMPKALAGDLNALAMSPIVYMQTGENRWQKVRVVPDAIVEETKKAQISAKFDIVPLNEATRW